MPQLWLCEISALHFVRGVTEHPAANSVLQSRTFKESFGCFGGSLHACFKDEVASAGVRRAVG